jgi:hypothetical protein
MPRLECERLAKFKTFLLRQNLGISAEYQAALRSHDPTIVNELRRMAESSQTFLRGDECKTGNPRCNPRCAEMIEAMRHARDTRYSSTSPEYHTGQRHSSLDENDDRVVRKGEFNE